MKEVNIGLEAEPEFIQIENYWDEDIVGKVTKLLHEYQEIFPTKFIELKDVVGDLGVM